MIFFFFRVRMCVFRLPSRTICKRVCEEVHTLSGMYIDMTKIDKKKIKKKNRVLSGMYIDIYTYIYLYVYIYVYNYIYIYIYIYI